MLSHPSPRIFPGGARALRAQVSPRRGRVSPLRLSLLPALDSEQRAPRPKEGKKPKKKKSCPSGSSTSRGQICGRSDHLFRPGPEGGVRPRLWQRLPPARGVYPAFSEAAARCCGWFCAQDKGNDTFCSIRTGTTRCAGKWQRHGRPRLVRAPAGNNSSSGKQQQQRGNRRGKRQAVWYKYGSVCRRVTGGWLGRLVSCHNNTALIAATTTTTTTTTITSRYV